MERIMEKKYQIFISSTYEDLKEERKKVQDTILSMYQFPIGMEMFSAADEEQWEIIRETIDSSDYYVLIIGHRYGSVIEEGEYAGMSYTQKEFRYALEQKIPVLAFLIDSCVAVTPDKMEQDADKREKLKQFIEEVKDGRTVQWWTSKDDLANKVMNSLNKQTYRGKRSGWIRTQSLEEDDLKRKIVELDQTVKDLNVNKQELQREIMELNNKNKQLIAENGELENKLYNKLPDFSMWINDYNEIHVRYFQGKENNTWEAFLEQLKGNKAGIYGTKIPLEAKLCNIGKYKATDVNVCIHIPDELKIIELGYKNERDNEVRDNKLEYRNKLQERVTGGEIHMLYKEMKIKEVVSSNRYFLVAKSKGIFRIVAVVKCKEISDAEKFIYDIVVD